MSNPLFFSIILAVLLIYYTIIWGHSMIAEYHYHQEQKQARKDFEELCRQEGIDLSCPTGIRGVLD